MGKVLKFVPRKPKEPPMNPALPLTDDQRALATVMLEGLLSKLGGQEVAPDPPLVEEDHGDLDQ